MRKSRIRVCIILVIVLFESCWIIVLQSNIIKTGMKENEKRKYQDKTERMIEDDIKCFPVMQQYCNEITMEDDYGNSRINGKHEGLDIMYKRNKTGVIPIVSATDGVIQNIGWLYLGGYRIGILANSGIYYYYAHFDSYVPGLYVGKDVKAGEFLGFMGNSGEGEEGTKGKFPVHLHFGIYIKDKNGNENTLNPYPFLSKINSE